MPGLVLVLVLVQSQCVSTPLISLSLSRQTEPTKLVAEPWWKFLCRLYLSIGTM